MSSYLFINQFSRLQVLSAAVRADLDWVYDRWWHEAFGISVAFACGRLSAVQFGSVGMNLNDRISIACDILRACGIDHRSVRRIGWKTSPEGAWVGVLFYR